MNTWYTSDIHFGHVNIIKYEHRPFDSVEEMNEGIIHRWNGQVDPMDSVIIVGDLCMGKIMETLPLVSRLNGFKILRAGNHDRCWIGNGDKSEEWLQTYHEAGIHIIDAGLGSGDTVIEKLGYRLDHFPYDEIERHEDRFTEWMPRNYGDWLVHGHVHAAWRQKGRQINVGLDPWGGRLVHELEIDQLRKAGEHDLPAIPWNLLDPADSEFHELSW